MLSKKTQPALYEKMRRHGPIEASPQPMQSFDDEVHAPMTVNSENWLQAGRLIRMPVGWAIVAAVVGVVAILIAYTSGHQRGQSAERAKFERSVASSVGSGASELTTLDPLVEPASTNGRGVLSYSPPGGSQQNAPLSVKSSPPAAWGPVEPPQDPRRKGLTYFVLAETNQSGALKLAEYCRANGLETYVVLAKNKRRQVIAFPGFPRSERLKSDIKALEAQIHAIGAKWKRNERGDSDLSDAYPLTYNG